MGRADAEYEAVVDGLRSWAQGREDVVAVAIVGSFARGEQRPDSDIDVVLVVTDPSARSADRAWIAEVLGPEVVPVRRRTWGALVEDRVRLPSGREVELGIVAPAWTAIDPVDPGTHRVVRDGCVPVHDPHGILTRLIAAVRARRSTRTS